MEVLTFRESPFHFLFQQYILLFPHLFQTVYTHTHTYVYTEDGGFSPKIAGPNEDFFTQTLPSGIVGK